MLALAAVNPAAAQAIGAAALAQIRALEEEKAGRTPAQQKLESQLIFKAKKHRGQAIARGGVAALTAALKVPADGRELVDISATVSPALLADLAAAGAEVVNSVPRFQAIRARVPLATLETIAARADVRFIRTAVPAITRAGPLTSEGDVAHEAATARANFKATGAGVRVAVLSDSVDHLAASQARGELGPVTVLPNQSGLGNGSSGEGTAMLEIVHDIAPDASLYFASAFLSSASFAQNILNLRSAGCDIIVDDVFYFDESPFQDGPIAQAARQVVEDGALFFSAAGNDGNKNDGQSGTWEGDFVDGGATASPISKAGRVHSFGGQNYDLIAANSPYGYAALHWADPLGASANDYDLYVLDASGTTVVSAGNTTQNGTQDPLEFVQPTEAGQRLVVVKADGAADRFLHLTTFGGLLSISTSGDTKGHSAAEGVLGVAATSAAGRTSAFTAASVVEYFSSDGPRRVFYHPDGAAITPGNFSSTGGVLLQKPDLTAADGVVTSVPGFRPFYGTSAAAPHAGALAALLKSFNPASTVAEIRTALLTGALDIETPGIDRDSGVGIVRPLPGLATLTGGPIVAADASSLASESFAPANGRIDAGETVTVSLGLKNNGPVPTANLTATLIASDEIGTPSAPQNYGALAANGGTASRTFSFRANGKNGRLLAVKLRLSDGAAFLGEVPFAFPLGSSGTASAYSNPAAITINDLATATPYPSTVNVAGFTGRVGKVTLTLNGLTHTFPDDVEVLLVSPGGTASCILAGAGGGTAASHATVTFDESSANLLGDNSGGIPSGTYQPACYRGISSAFASPAPGLPYQSGFTAFQGEDPNGTWQLFVRDAGSGDSGSIDSGWTLNLSPDTSGASGSNADLAVTIVASDSTVTVPGQVEFITTVTNNGPVAASDVTLTEVLPANLTFTGGTVSQGGGSVSSGVATVSFGTIPSGGQAVLTLDASGNAVGAYTVTASATHSAADNDPADNTATIHGAVGLANLAPVQLPGWSDKIVVSTARGTTTDDAFLLTGADLFVNLALTNSGTATANAYFYTALEIDGVPVRYFDRQLPLSPAGVVTQRDVPIGPLPAGAHTIRVLVDAMNEVGEADETDNEFTKTIFVGSPPTISGTLAGQTVTDNTTIQPFAGVTIADADGDPLAVSVTLDAAEKGALSSLGGFTDAGGGVYTFSGTPAAATTALRGLVFVPAANRVPVGQSETTTFTLSADDGTTASVTDSATTVTSVSVNDAPGFAAGANQTALEDAGVQTIPNWATAVSAGPANEAGQALSFIVESDNPGLFAAGPSIAASGTLTYTPAPNASGTAGITVRLQDNGGTANGGVDTSAPVIFQITVLAVNDAPSFVKGTDQTAPQNGGPQTVAGWATAISPGPADEAGQGVSFGVTTNNDALFAALPAVSPTGTLTYTLAGSASGSAIVTVVAQDSGGTANGGVNTSAPQTFQIHSLPVNDPPEFVLAGDVSVPQDEPDQTLPGFASGIRPGPADEAGQTVSFLVMVDRPELFAIAPVISPTGTLSFRAKPDASGAAQVTVRLKDDGGTADGGNDTSAPQTFSIAITSYAEETGTYEGLALPAPLAAPAAEKTGSIRLALRRSGRFTGRLRLGSLSFVLRGEVDQAGVATFGRHDLPALALNRKGRPPLALALQVDVAGGTDRLTGSITEDGLPFATITADRALYTAHSNPRPPLLRTPPEIVGRYTVSFGAPTALDPGTTAFPNVGGFATVRIVRSGRAYVAGLLADGTRFGVASLLSKANEFPIYDAPYRRRTGALVGRLRVRELLLPEPSDLDGTGLLWFAPANSRRGANYPAGWPGGLSVDAAGSTWDRPNRRGQNVFPGLTAPDADGNARLTVEGGGLSAAIVAALRLGPSYRAEVVPPAAAQLRLNIGPFTGLLRGEFVHPQNGRKARLHGVILQGRGTGEGFFLGPDETGSFLLEETAAPGVP